MNNIDLLQYLVSGSESYTLETITFNMAVTTILGLFIFLIYKKTFNGVLYSRSFNVTIVIISMISAMVIMLIGGNLAISLGMVGALSIVRFRSAVKEPRDLAFLFWAIAVGLASGTGAFLIAGVGSIFVAFMMIVFSRPSYRDGCYLLILKGQHIDAEEIADIFKEYGLKNKLRMKNLNDQYMEVTYEVFIKKVKEQRIVDHFKSLKSISEVNLVSFNGEITG